MRRDTQRSVFGSLLFAKAALLCRHLQHATQTACVDRVLLNRLSVIPRLDAVGREVHHAVFAQVLQHVAYVIRVVGYGQFIEEAVDCKGVVHMRHRSQPAEADMIWGRAIFGPDIRNVVGQFIQAHACLELGTVLRAGCKGRGDRRKRGTEEP